MKLRLLILAWALVWAQIPVAGAAEGTELALLDKDAVKLVEGPNDENIAKITARILQSSHYNRQPINDEVSGRFLDRYLDALDNLHISFTQQDVEEFERYRTRLDELTVRMGDTEPARLIFNRFRERIEQQYRYVVDLLSHEKFEFTTDERCLINRRKLPRPADLDEAKRLWRERVRYEYLQEKLNNEKPEEIINIINRRYTRMVRTIRDYDNDDVMQLYLTALAHVFDPHSDYFGKSELENFSIGMKLSLYGIGAVLRSEDGYCKIDSLVVGGPAERSKKLKPKDKIIAVAQGESEFVDVVDMKLRKVVELIRGPEKSEVRLRVIPGDAEDPSKRIELTLVREQIKLEDQAAKARIIEVKGPEDKPLRLGVIDLPSFYATFDIEGTQGGGEKRSTTSDVAKLLKKLKSEQVRGVVLDLRRNGGGSLEEAINLTGLFIKEGTVVQVKDSQGNIYEDKDTDPTVLYDGPLVVLTSRFSASASEILAGALQDHGRALIVGDSSTHGKGTVQSLIQLAPIMRSHGLPYEPSPGAVKITIRKFYRPSGASTQLRGVIPDIVLPSINNHADVGESSLDNALPYDTIKPSSFDKLDRVAPYLSDLRTRSEARVARDPDYAFVREEIERYKKAIEDKSVSMNEEQRLREKKEADQRRKDRRKSLAQRPPPAATTYEINLKQADEPGLPEPLKKTGLSPDAAKAAGPGQPAAKDQAKAEPAKTVVKAESEDGEEDEDAEVTAVDYTLEEVERILLDLIDLSVKRESLAAAKRSPAN